MEPWVNNDIYPNNGVNYSFNSSGAIKFIQLHNFAPIVSSLSLLFVYFSLRVSCSLSWLTVMFLFFFFYKEKSDLVWLTATFTDYSYIIYHRETERGWESESLSLPLRDLNAVFTQTHTHTHTQTSCIRPLILKTMNSTPQDWARTKTKIKCTTQTYPGPNPNITAGVKIL